MKWMVLAKDQIIKIFTSENWNYKENGVRYIAIPGVRFLICFWSYFIIKVRDVWIFNCLNFLDFIKKEANILMTVSPDILPSIVLQKLALVINTESFFWYLIFWRDLSKPYIYIFFFFQRCCPDMVNKFLEMIKAELAITENKKNGAEKGKLIMLVSDFYYGRHEGAIDDEQKTYTTFKCFSCLKVLKNNIRYVNIYFSFCLKIGMLLI